MRAALAALMLLCAAPAAADPLYEAVDAYALFQTDVSTLATMAVSDQVTMDAALALALRHDPRRVAQGYMAYGALTAAQSPEFVAGVRSRVTAAGRAAVLRQLNRDVTYARRRPPGAENAISYILIAIAGDGVRMTETGDRFTLLADSIAYAPTNTAERDQRSARLRLLSAERRSVDAALSARIHPAVLSSNPITDLGSFGSRSFWDALAGITQPRERLRYHSRFPLVDQRHDMRDRMLTLAGLFIVQAGATPRVHEMLDDARLAECLGIEQLELRQCASVSASASEDAHCLAQHGLTQPAACFAEIAEAP